MNWIKLNERQPKKWQNVLISYRGVTLTAYYNGACFDPCYCMIEENDRSKFDHVIPEDIEWWMPLPEKPNEDEQ